MSSLQPHNGIRGQEPPMLIQRPSAGQSQDIRHILARVFKDLYTRDTIRPDTVKNLQTSKGGDDPYHEQYVENLQKIYDEWQQRMDEAAMLERHIMQAQARAMSADERALNKASKSCDNFNTLGLPPVCSHFKSCIDTELLKKHNLLTPIDYMVHEVMTVPAPKEETCCECWEELRSPDIPDYARDTLASQQHSRPNTQRLPTSPALLDGSEDFPSFLSEENTKLRPVETYEEKVNQPEFPKKAGWKEFLSEEQREIDRRDLNLINAKVNYLRNPRYVAPENVKSLIKPSKKKLADSEKENQPKETPSDPVIFEPHPSVVMFTNYKVGEVYEITLELKNVSSVMRQCRVLPPSSSIFTVGLGQFPGENGLVAPGMSCRYNIRFSPNSLKNYDDSISVQAHGIEPINISVIGRRPPPILTLSKEVDVGYCLVGGIQVTQLIVKNEGGEGKFCVMNKNKWPSTSFRTLMPNISKMNIKQSTFLVMPATFELFHGQSIVLEVIFSPQSARSYIQEMIMACDNCHTIHFKLKGEGQPAKVMIAEEIETVFSEPLLGELCDVTAQHLLRFDDLNPYTYTEKKIRIQNHTKVEIPYQWMVFKPIIKANTEAGKTRDVAVPEERAVELNSVFSIHPPGGLLQPAEITEFIVTFAPPKEEFYHSTAHLILQHIPVTREMTEDFNRTSMNSIQEDEFPSANVHSGGVLVKDVTSVQIEMKGKCIPLNVVLHPYAIILQPSVLVGTTIKRLFTMANHSYSIISFQWESYIQNHIIEIEPPYGELDPGMAMDLEVSITGVEPGLINHTLFCHVVHLHEPLPLFIHAEFKGPELAILEPSVYFGLVKVGQSSVKEITILNTSQMRVKFRVHHTEQERNDNQTVNDLQFSVTSGEICPLERTTVQLIFSPKIAKILKTAVEVRCEMGNICSIAVDGQAQNPVVCFLECNKILKDVYLDVPSIFQAVLHNQTLLPTMYRLGKVQGTQKDFCSIEVDEEEGKILSWEQKSISIKFTPYKPIDFDDVIIPCSVQGQTEQLFLKICCHVQTLSVTYKTSADKTNVSEELQLNFGDSITLGQPVKRYVHILNQTAIPAYFKISPEYFAPSMSPLDDVNNPSTSQSNRMGLLSRTSNLADPMSKTPVKMIEDYKKMILSGKKGATFVPQPAIGHLKPFGEQIIEVTLFSDMWGTYMDQLIIEIGDQEKVQIPMKGTVGGCPLSCQLSSGVPGLKNIVRFGHHSPGAKPVRRKLKITNSSPVDIRINWQVYEASKNSQKLIDFITTFGRCFSSEENLLDMQPMPTILETSCTINKINYVPSDFLDDIKPGAKSNILSCYIRPHEGEPISEPFSISPQVLTIPGHGHDYVTLTFKPLHPEDVTEAINFVGYADGYCSLDTEEEDKSKVSRLEGYSVDHLRIEFSAGIAPPMLTVEEMDDDGLVIRAAMDNLMKDGKSMNKSVSSTLVMLTNNTLAQLTFDLKVKKPFILDDLQSDSEIGSSSRAIKTNMCTLKPGNHIVVKPGLQLTRSVLNMNTAVRVNSHLEIRNNLNINYSNGLRQLVPMVGVVAVPQLEISTSSVDFGYCLVGQMRYFEVMLTNDSYSDSYWYIMIEPQFVERASFDQDISMFQISPNEGMTPANKDNLCNNKTLLTISFTPLHSQCYNAVIKIIGKLGELSQSILVTGIGSYDGKYEAILNI